MITQLFLIAGDGLRRYVVLLIFYLAVELVIVRFYKKNQVVVPKGFLVGWQLLMCLLSAIFSITGTGSLNDIIKYGSTYLSASDINLIPFRNGIDWFGILMNVVMFVPLGILLPLLWKRGQGFGNTVLTGLVFSLLIELSQLPTFRATDINDLITNTLGAAVGYAIYALLFRKLRIIQLDNQGKSSNTRINRLIHFSSLTQICLIFLLNFILLDPIINVFYNWYFGLFTQ